VPVDPSNMSNTALMQNMGAQNEYSSNTQVLWGTNINTNELQTQLREFLLTFTIMPNADDMQDDYAFNIEPYYITQLKQIAETEQYVLDINCAHLHEFNASLYRKLEDYPADVIPIFDLVALSVFKEQIGYGNQGDMQGSNLEHELNEQIIQVRPFNMTKSYQIRELDPKHIDKLISIKGIIIRTSDTVPEMKEACFRCIKCHKEEYKYIERGKITEPEVCDQCKGRHTFEMIHNSCMFSDKQHVKMQETPEAVKDGETPQTVQMCAYEDLVDHVKPGDRVEVVGIYRAKGIQLNSAMRTLKNIYRTYIDVIGYIKTDTKRYENDAEKPAEAQDQEMQDENQAGNEDMDQALNQEHDINFSAEQVRKFKELAANPSVYDILIDALAPSIWECHDVKKGILC
jgi:DNA replication licensing factor MCM4